jgi:hypothetical protein
MGKAPDSIKKLVDRFNQQSGQLRSPDYNETLIRGGGQNRSFLKKQNASTLNISGVIN